MMSPPEEQTATPPGEGAAAKDASGEANSRDGSGNDPHQKQTPPRIGKVHALSDVRAVEAFRMRLERETGGTVRASSMWKLVVEEERRGSYARKAQIGSVKFDEQGTAVASAPEYAPDPSEAEAIRKEWAQCSWPTYQPVLFTGKYQPHNAPKFPWSFADPANLAVCKSPDGQTILCVEERRYADDGRKDVFIWTYWAHADEGRWHCLEPPGLLPLFGLEGIGSASTIFIHEGPKSAKAALELIADEERCAAHPWGPELRGWRLGAVAHVGWLGGAERPNATDWRPLASTSARIIVVCDNDNPGRNAVRHISRRIRREMWMIQFDDRFPERFDMADAVAGLPAGLFEDSRDEA